MSRYTLEDQHPHSSHQVEKDNACDNADLAEQKTKAAKLRSEKAVTEAEELCAKSQKLEVQLTIYSLA